MTKDNHLKVGSRVKLYFYIGLHIKDIALLGRIQNFFGVGNIYPARESLSRYQVGSIEELKVIIDHFDKYPLVTNKHADFSLFKEVYNLMVNKEHLTPEGLHKIAAIRASMNRGLSDNLKGVFPNLATIERPRRDLSQITDPN